MTVRPATLADVDTVMNCSMGLPNMSMPPSRSRQTATRSRKPWLGRNRGQSYGRALLTAVAAVAAARGGGRLEWSVFDWNEPATEFYERRLGASMLDDRTTFRLSGGALAQVARRQSSRVTNA